MIKYLFLLFSSFAFGQGSIIFDTGFETAADLDGTADAWRDDIASNNSTWTLVGGAREGSFCLKMEAVLGEIRNEIVKQAIFNWNTDYWVGYAMKVVEPVLGNEITSQHRPQPSGVNSFTSRTTTSTNLQFRTSTNDAFTNTTPGTSAIDNTEAFNYTYSVGEWIDIVIHFNLATTGGYVEAWANGTKVVDITTGTTVYTKDLTGATKTAQDYFKIGLYYGSGSDASGEIHFDAVRVWEGSGGTYGDVVPGGTPEDPPVGITIRPGSKNIRVGVGIGKVIIGI